MPSPQYRDPRSPAPLSAGMRPLLKALRSAHAIDRRPTPANWPYRAGSTPPTTTPASPPAPGLHLRRWDSAGSPASSGASPPSGSRRQSPFPPWGSVLQPVRRSSSLSTSSPTSRGRCAISPPPLVSADCSPWPSCPLLLLPPSSWPLPSNRPSSRRPTTRLRRRRPPPSATRPAMFTVVAPVAAFPSALTPTRSPPVARSVVPAAPPPSSEPHRSCPRRADSAPSERPQERSPSAFDFLSGVPSRSSLSASIGVTAAIRRYRASPRTSRTGVVVLAVHALPGRFASSRPVSVDASSRTLDVCPSLRMDVHHHDSRGERPRRNGRRAALHGSPAAPAPPRRCPLRPRALPSACRPTPAPSSPTGRGGTHPPLRATPPAPDSPAHATRARYSQLTRRLPIAAPPPPRCVAAPRAASPGALRDRPVPHAPRSVGRDPLAAHSRPTGSR